MQSGIGGFGLADNRDRAFGFDDDHSRRPGPPGVAPADLETIRILKYSDGSFSPVCQMGSPRSSIGGFSCRGQSRGKWRGGALACRYHAEHEL
jgi:hypothetical protein